jgi:hypothetical protein
MTKSDMRLLRELIIATEGSDVFALGDGYLEPIKQAFIDQGWSKPLDMELEADD